MDATHSLKRRTETIRQRRGTPLNWGSVALPILVVALVGLWDLVVAWRDYPAFLLPSPGLVAQRFVTAWQSGTLQMHTLITLSEVLGGLALGLSVAVVLGYVLAKSRQLERAIAPLLVASQAIPIVALAPLLVIWFGAGSFSKVLVCALTLFFPVLINTIVGVRGVERDLYELMRSLEATPWQIYIKLEMPAALPVLVGGLKVGVTLSVIGAVVGEFVAADRGLGFMVNLARGLFDTPLMFVALFTLMAIALGLYGLVVLLERLLLGRRFPDA